MGAGSDWRRPAWTFSRMATLRASRCSGHHLPRRVGVESKNYTHGRCQGPSQLMLGSQQYQEADAQANHGQS